LAKDTWRVAASDCSESTIILPALNGLRRVAPHTRLALFNLLPARLVRQAEEGDIDLAFHTAHDSPVELRRRILYAERYVLAGRAGHPRLTQAITREQFCDLEQAMVSPDGGGFFGPADTALAELGLSRRVVLSVPHFLFMVQALVSSDLVAMVPSRLVRDNPALTLIEPPIAVAGFEMAMLWPERCHRDPAHKWLREFICNAL
jgi:DNA-binding transcriptional LysR family regulator